MEEAEGSGERLGVRRKRRKQLRGMEKIFVECGIGRKGEMKFKKIRSNGHNHGQSDMIGMMTNWMR